MIAVATIILNAMKMRIKETLKIEGKIRKAKLVSEGDKLSVVINDDVARFRLDESESGSKKVLTLKPLEITINERQSKRTGVKAKKKKGPVVFEAPEDER